jgi:hypothetical protein
MSKDQAPEELTHAELAASSWSSIVVGLLGLLEVARGIAEEQFNKLQNR